MRFSLADLPRQYRSAMDREDRREPWTSELLDDVDDTRFIGSLADQPAEIRCMKLPVGARCGPDLVMKHLRILVSRAQRYQPGHGRWSRA